MPRNSKPSVLLRQWELLKLLPSTGTGKTASELTIALNNAGFIISKRQIERDLNDLGEVFVLDRNDTNFPNEWKWVKGASIDLPSMTVSEALSLQLVEGTLKTLMPISMIDGLETRFKQAEKQLAVLSKDSSKARWASKIRTVIPSMPLIPPVIDSAILATVQEALLADEQIEVEYTTQNKLSKHLVLHPLALVNRGAVAYLIATTFEYDDIRLYAVHRIHKAERNRQPAKRPSGFDLDDYIQAGGLHFGNGKNIRLKAFVSEYLANILEETPLSVDQKLNRLGDQIKLTATVADSWEMTWWLMSHGAGIEVLAPASLRKKIAGLLTDAAALYEEK